MKKPILMTSLFLSLFAPSAFSMTFPTKGNEVIALTNGHDLNLKRLELVEGADKFIYIKTFIINRDPSEAPVYEALCRKAQAGVDVRLLVDDLGRLQGGNRIRNKKGPFSIAWFKSCGMRFERYSKISWGPIDYALYHQHDKMLVTENGAIMGGTNYSRDYSSHGQFSKSWYDFDIALKGPAACSLQKIFNGSWWRAFTQEFVGIKSLSTKKRRRRITDRFSPHTLEEACHAPQNSGDEDVSIIFNDPKFFKGYPFQDYLIASTDEVIKKDVKKSINLYAPYFIPKKEIVTKLVQAAKAGVRVRIITNSEESVDPEAFTAYVAMLMRVGPLLKGGVEIYLWSPSDFPETGLEEDNVIHKKGGCFSDVNCFVGSHNLDIRGEKYCSELMAVLTRPQTVKERNASFEDDIRYTFRLTEDSRKVLLKNSKITQKILAKISGWAL